MGDNNEPTINNRRKVDRQVAEAVLIAQRILGFNDVTEKEVLAIMQTEEQVKA